MPRSSLNALLLAGGRSRRMSRDKATLTYGGQLQLTRTTELLAKHCPETYLSLREGQNMPTEGLKIPTIEDNFGEIGPLGGILSAFSCKPNDSWLVVACDLPYLTDETLRNLLKERDTKYLATAYRSAHDGLPEPLCAVYEPEAFPEMRRFLEEENERCPRKILIQSKTKLIEPVDNRALDNINTPEQYEEAVAQLTR